MARQGDFFDDYPVHPGTKSDDDTTHAAAEDIASRASTLRGKVYRLLLIDDLTADECAKRLDESVLTIRPRLSELRALNLITDTYERRMNASGKFAIVWAAVPRSKS